MRWIRFIILVCSLALSGCNLVMTRVVTPTPSPTSTPASGLIIIEPPQQTPEPTAGCTPRTDWPTYIVQVGDTLQGIADQAGTSIPDLVAANCISDPNSIFVGQSLYVPQPIANTGLSGSVPQGDDNYQLVISPTLGVQAGGWITLQPGVQITLQWEQNTSETPDHVDFDFSPTGTGVTPTVIGTANATQGWAMQWVVPSGLLAHLSAVATMTDGTIRTTPLYSVVSAG